MSFMEVVEQSMVPELFQEALIGSMREGLDSIRHRIYGDDERMNVIENDGIHAPWESGWEPGHIYEICLFESTFKDQLIRNLRHANKDHLFISDQYYGFSNLGTIQTFLESISITARLLIIDISEILYLDFIKDAEKLRTTFESFYSSLEKLTMTGTTCVIFVNYFYYSQIFRNLVRPNSIQVFIYSPPSFPFWKVETFPGLNSWRLLARPALEEFPYFL